MARIMGSGECIPSARRAVNGVAVGAPTIRLKLVESDGSASTRHALHLVSAEILGSRLLEPGAQLLFVGRELGRERRLQHRARHPDRRFGANGERDRIARTGVDLEALLAAQEAKASVESPFEQAPDLHPFETGAERF